MLPGRQYKPADFVLMARRRLWVIVVPLMLGAYAALIVSSRAADMYESELLIQVVPQRVPDTFVRSTVTTRTEDRLAGLSEQIKSRTELERLITQLNLYAADRTRMPLQDVVDLMRSQIIITPVMSKGFQSDTEAFYVRFSYPDAETVARVAERLGALFIDVNARDRDTQAQATNNFIQTQLADARRRLEEHEEKLEAFRLRNAGRLPNQLDFNMQAIQSTQLQIQAVVESMARDRDRRLMLERMYLDAQAEPSVLVQPPQAAAAHPADPTAAGGTTEQQLATAREALSRMELRLRPGHPDVVRTKRLVAELENRQAAETDAKARADARAASSAPVVAAPVAASATDAAKRQRLQQMQAEMESLQRQLEFKQSQEERLRGLLTGYQTRIEQVPGVESEWTALTRDYDTMQTAYKTLLAKAQDANVAAELEQRQVGEQFRIVDPARTPIRPTGVNRLQINAAGAAGGLVLGLLLAALLEFRDRTLRSSEDVGAVFHLPVVALVPHIATRDEQQRLRWRRIAASAVVTVAVLAGSYVFWALRLWKHVT